MKTTQELEIIIQHLRDQLIECQAKAKVYKDYVNKVPDATAEVLAKMETKIQECLDKNKYW